jgi:hypothetical protein
MHGIHKLYQWAGTAEAVVRPSAYKLLEAQQFIFKYVLISIALWLPAVFKHSARKFILANKGQLDQTLIDFYYVEKGIW